MDLFLKMYNVVIMSVMSFPHEDFFFFLTSLSHFCSKEKKKRNRSADGDE